MPCCSYIWQSPVQNIEGRRILENLDVYSLRCHRKVYIKLPTKVCGSASLGPDGGWADDPKLLKGQAQHEYCLFLAELISPDALLCEGLFLSPVITMCSRLRFITSAWIGITHMLRNSPLWEKNVNQDVQIQSRVDRSVMGLSYTGRFLRRNKPRRQTKRRGQRARRLASELGRGLMTMVMLAAATAGMSSMIVQSQAPPLHLLGAVGRRAKMPSELWRQQRGCMGKGV